MQRMFVRVPHVRYAAVVVLGVAALLALILSVALADSAKPAAEPTATTRGAHAAPSKRPAVATTGAKRDVVPAAPGAGAIFGRLLANGTPVANESVSLREYDTSSDVAVDTVTSGNDGVYTFVNPPTPPTGKTYYVRYGVNSTKPEYVNVWYGPDIVGYTAGNTVSGGDLDIANVPLVSPPSGSTVGIPATFTWQPRTAPTDWYRWALVDATTFEGWIFPTVQNGGSYTLSSTNGLTGFQFGADYLWYVEITDTTATNSYGYSFDAWDVFFTEGGTPAASETPTATATTAAATATVTPTATGTGPTATVTPTATAGTSYPVYLPHIAREVAPRVVTPAAP
ncbi:MAG: hypothetical protein U0768_08315 [Anaerolineae bacterium]